MTAFHPTKGTILEEHYTFRLTGGSKVKEEWSSRPVATESGAIDIGGFSGAGSSALGEGGQHVAWKVLGAHRSCGREWEMRVKGRRRWAVDRASGRKRDAQISKILDETVGSPSRSLTRADRLTDKWAKPLKSQRNRR